MSLDLFTQAHTEHLAAAVADNLDRYVKAVKPWADKPAGVCLPTGLALREPLDFVMPGTGRGEERDFEDAVMLYQALPPLTRAMAADARMWTRLCHVEGWAYMRKRWDVRAEQEAHPDDPGRVLRYVREHYFVAGPRPSRALTRNGVARLWWYAHLTHDPQRADVYELTRELLSQLDTAQQLLERNFGRAPDVLHGFLQHLIDAGDTLGDGHARRDHIRHLSKWLNRRGGFCVLDTLDRATLAALLNAETHRYIAAA